MHMKPIARRLVAFAAFLFASAALALCASAQGSAAHDRIRDMIDARELVRLHIIANSDDDADQARKLEVRDALLARFTAELSGFDSADDCFARVQSLLPDMEACARETLARGGYYGPVVAIAGVFDFPDRTYGGVFVPAGSYPALRIVIGEGQGHNWWCVMYPPLCFTGSDALAAPDDVQFQSAIAEWIHPAARAAEASTTPVPTPTASPMPTPPLAASVPAYPAMGGYDTRALLEAMGITIGYWPGAAPLDVSPDALGPIADPAPTAPLALPSPAPSPTISPAAPPTPRPLPAPACVLADR